MLCIVTQFPPALPVGLFHPLMAVLLFFLRALAKLAGLKRHWHHKGIQHEPQQGSVFNMWSDIYISKEADEKKNPAALLQYLTSSLPLFHHILFHSLLPSACVSNSSSSFLFLFSTFRHSPQREAVARCVNGTAFKYIHTHVKCFICLLFAVRRTMWS